MKDYKLLWARWMGLLNAGIADRKQLLDLLHIELTKGFDVITRISVEELEHVLSNTHLYKTIKNDLEASLAYCVFAGYALLLIDKDIDPQKENLIARNETNALGNVWMEHYTKDQGQSLLATIDPIFSLFLEKIQQNQINKLLSSYTLLRLLSYDKGLQLETFHNWAAHQGYILGMLENKLHKKTTS